MWSYAVLVTLLIGSPNVSNAQIFPDGGCSICPASLPVVGSPDVVLPAGSAAGVVMDDLTCAEVEAMAQAGSFTSAQCVLLRVSSIPNDCGCEASPDAPTLAPVEAPVEAPVATPTEMPVSAPIEAPVAAPTDTPVAVPVAVPTDTPVGVPVAVPTDAPVEAPVDAPTPAAGSTVTESVTIRLTSLTSELEGANAETFLEVCEEFYLEQLMALNVSCAFSARRRKLSRYLRALQGNLTASPMDVATDVTSTFATAEESATYEQDLLDAIEQNSALFITMLQTRGDAVSQFFFESVESVDAFSPTAVPPLAPVASPVAAPVAATPTAPAPVAAPTAEDDGDGGLSGGAVAGIVIGVVGALAIVIAAILNMPDKPKSRDASVMDTAAADYPAADIKPSTNVAPAAAAAVASVAPSAVDSNVKDGMSVMTGEMDAYSLSAGNVDHTSTVPGSKGEGMSHQSGDEMSSHAMSSLRQNMVSRTVIAPPGKLGIVIDTTLEGPVVHKINPQSPLEGLLFAGDIIVGIDEVDTRAMSASAITALMVRTANTRRILHVLSEDVTN